MTYRDSRQAWFVATASSLLFVLSTGNSRSNGVFFIPLIEAENLTRSDASWPFNLAGAISIVAAPLTGFLVSHFSPACTCILGSVLFVAGQMPGYFTTNIYVLSCFYGIVRGIGLTILPTVGVMVTSSSFVRYRSTAMGLCLAGGSIGGMIIPIAAQHLLIQYGLQGTFLLMAGISMHSFVFSLALMWYRDDDPAHTAPSEENERTSLLTSAETDSKGNKRCDSETQEKWKETASILLAGTEEHKLRLEGLKDGPSVKTLLNVPKQAGAYKKAVEKSLTEDFRMVKQICSSPGFIFLTLIQVGIVMITAAFTQVVLDYLKEKNINEMTSVYCLSLVSGGEIIGKLFLGMILDANVLSFSTHAAIFLILGGAMSYLFTFSANVPLLFIMAFVYGAASGAVLTSNVVHVNDYVPRDRIHMAQALTKGFQGLGFFTVAPTIGLFRDRLQSYDYLFYYLSSVQFILAFISVIEGIYFKHRMPVSLNK